MTNILFIIVSLLTFANLIDVQWESSAGHLGSELNGVLAACFMSPVLTAFLDLAGFLILAKKTYALSGTGVSYGKCDFGAWSRVIGCWLIDKHFNSSRVQSVQVALQQATCKQE